MAKREIVLSSDPFLRNKSKKVDKFDETLWEMLDDMRETLFEEEGAGLAAVQVGFLRRVFITNINDCYIEFVNPEIISKKGQQTHKEGCLSVKEPWATVIRPKEVAVRAFDRNGNQFTYICTDWSAVCVMHEYDHLEGVIYTDRAIKE